MQNPASFVLIIFQLQNLASFFSFPILYLELVQQEAATMATTAKPEVSKPAGASATRTGGHIPKGAPEGGDWVFLKHSGAKTWSIISATGCILLFCTIIFAPFAIMGLLCPCDEKLAYMSPDGVIYDVEGNVVGSRAKSNFKHSHKATAEQRSTTEADA